MEMTEQQQTMPKVSNKRCFCRWGAVITFTLIFGLQFIVYVKLKATAEIMSHLKNVALGTPGVLGQIQHKNIEVKPNFTESFNDSIKTKEKLILYWNSFFAAPDWDQGYGHKPFRNCKVKNCVTTRDKGKIEDSHAILCHMRSEGCRVTQLPKIRKPHQYWIYYLLESQENSLNGLTGQGLVPYNGVFNLTMTFKLDSDIWLPFYSRHNDVIDELNNKNFVFHTGTKASVAWVVSNCYTSTAVRGRMAYFARLAKSIAVKRYGRCLGYMPCGPSCFTDLAKEHKFYFAAENTLCKDYITEKPWNALKVGMIPIVYGLGDYSKVLPLDSYIDVRNFKSPHLLASYLKQVASNETMYNSYFKWRGNYKQLQKMESSFCRLCVFLNQPNPPKRTINNLDKFWSHTNDCVTPEKFNSAVIA